MRTSRIAAIALSVALSIGTALATSGCAASAAGVTGWSATKVRVVAAENVWGSIAQQLGGPYADVVSIVDSPDADPHDYEPTASDARAVASADLVIVNGVGYDPWASKLVAANPVDSRQVLTVGELLGVPDGGNPHRWYEPDDVAAVIDRLVKDLAQADPAHAAAFAAQRTAFETGALKQYEETVAAIRATYAGTPIGASESIVAMIAPALGLDLVTPPGFLKAVSEGTDPTAGDKTAADRQIADHRIEVYVDNPQNATPDVQGQLDAATAAGIPVTSMTETMVPATGTWQDWQTRQLVALRAALARATGR